MKYRAIFLLIIYFFIIFLSDIYSQQIGRIQNPKQIVVSYIDSLNNQAEKFIGSELDSLQKAASTALNLSNQVGYQDGAEKARFLLGICAATTEDYSSSFELLYNYLNYANVKGDISAQVNVLVRIGLLYLEIENYDLALVYCSNSVKTACQSRLPGDLALAYRSLATYYYQLEELVSAIKFADSSFKYSILSERNENTSRIEKLYGDIYIKTDCLDRSLVYYQKALADFTVINNMTEEAIILTRIAHIFELQNNLDEALKFSKKALSIRLMLNNKELTSHSLINLGNAFVNLGARDSALYYYKKGLNEAYLSDNLRAISYALWHLYLFNKEINPLKAFHYLESYNNIHESFLTEKSNSKIYTIESKYIALEKEAQIKLLQQKNEIQQLALRNRSYSELITQLIIGTIGLLLLVLVFIAERSKLSKSRLELINRQLDEEIKERKKKEVRLRKSEQLYRLITDNSLDLIVRMDRNFRYLFISPSVYRMFGYDHRDRLEELPGLDRVIQPEFWPELRQEYRSMIRTGTPLMVTYQATRKDGSTFWAESHVNPIFEDHGGRLKETITVVRDISDRIAYEEVLSENARHKEVLLKEIHHRVKNNYSILISLINMQTLASDPGISRDVLKELQGRIRTMSLVHELLYQSDDVDFVEFNKYLNQLILVISTAFKSKPVSIKTHLESCILNIEIAMPLGLIVNEILTNAFKYAFSTEHKGKLWIDLKLLGDESEFHPAFSHSLSIRDNGPGLPEKFDLETRKSMGSQIIQLLTEQIQGKLVIANNKGASFTVYFRDETD